MKIFLQRISQEIMKKIILGTSDAWSTIRLSHRPSDPAYYIVNWRIFIKSKTTLCRGTKRIVGITAWMEEGNNCHSLLLLFCVSKKNLLLSVSLHARKKVSLLLQLLNKAELLQLNRTQFSSLGIFVSKKVGNQKN